MPVPLPPRNPPPPVVLPERSAVEARLGYHKNEVKRLTVLLDIIDMIRPAKVRPARKAKPRSLARG